MRKFIARIDELPGARYQRLKRLEGVIEIDLPGVVDDVSDVVAELRRRVQTTSVAKRID